MENVLPLIRAVVLMVIPKTVLSLTSAFQFAIQDVRMQIALLQMYVLVIMATQNMTQIKVNVSQFALLPASMEIAYNQINAPAILVISRTIRIHIDVYQIVQEVVKMEPALLQTSALVMKVSWLIITRVVCHLVQKVVSMGTALYSTHVNVLLDGQEWTVQFISSKQIQVQSKTQVLLIYKKI
jgi:hypothetical protein